MVPVTGMTCDACERRVSRALLALPGVDSVDVSARRGTAAVRGAQVPDLARLESAIRSAGYEPHAAPWLTSDPSTWITVATTALVLLAVAYAAAVGGLGDSLGVLVDPSGAGWSSCWPWASPQACQRAWRWSAGWSWAYRRPTLPHAARAVPISHLSVAGCDRNWRSTRAGSSASDFSVPFWGCSAPLCACPPPPSASLPWQWPW